MHFLGFSASQYSSWYFVLIVSDCPGTQSEQAGKTAACQGCPNQSLCSSGKVSGPDPGRDKYKVIHLGKSEKYQHLSESQHQH